MPYPFHKILLPVFPGQQPESALTLARAITGPTRLLLVGLIPVARKESLSTAAVAARQMRKSLRQLVGAEVARAKIQVRVTHQPWAELVRVAQDEAPDLLLLEWPGHTEALGLTPEEVLAHPPCDLALVHGRLAAPPERILVPVRGGPYAELALRLGLALVRKRRVKLTSLHLIHSSPTESKKEAQRRDAAFRGIARVLAGLPEVERRETATADPAETIVTESRAFELVIMGATARHSPAAPPLGAVAERLLKESTANLVIVKTQRPMPAEPASEEAGQMAISILVDKWFAENTYHADEFADLGRLLALKREQNLTISLALPALNEAETVGRVIGTVKQALMDRVPLLDEIVLIDSNSTDRTRAIAEKLGVPVYIHQQLLPERGARRGKGEALWKSLLVTRGGLIAWIDTDIVNIHPRFIYGLIGPLLINPQIQLIKGFYRRPLRVGDKLQAGGGGRVTELTARPLINLFYPELSGVIQPLSGEYGGRRAALEQLPFFSGYGVETGLLIDVFEKFGLGAIAQVDLRERVHHNQPLDALSKMSFAIIQAVIRKLERRYGSAMLEDVNRTMKLIRYEPGRFFLDVEEIAEHERPPMVEVAEYRERHSA